MRKLGRHGRSNKSACFRWRKSNDPSRSVHPQECSGTVGKTMNEPSLKDVVESHRTMLMQAKGVVGVAVGISKADPQKRSIQVYVTTNHWPDRLTHRLDGYEVE